MLSFLPRRDSILTHLLDQQPRRAVVDRIVEENGSSDPLGRHFDEDRVTKSDGEVRFSSPEFHEQLDQSPRASESSDALLAEHRRPGCKA